MPDVEIIAIASWARALHYGGMETRKTQQAEREKPAAALRRMLREDGIIIAPGAYDALSARLTERAGFPAVYMTGYGTSASELGEMDIGLLTMSEMVACARNMASAVSVPVIADADTGYGNYQNVMRAVREYEKAGVAAIHLEDQITPKRHVGIGGAQLIPLDEMLVKLEAALEARQDPDFVIIGRTDCLPSMGLDEAIRRGRAMAEAGADVVFIELMMTREEMEKVAESVPGPLLINQVEHTPMPLLPMEELRAMGYKIAILPLSALLSASLAIQEVMDELRRLGRTSGRVGRMMTPDELERAVGKEEFEALRARFGSTVEKAGT